MDTDSDTVKSLCYFGTCATLSDADEFLVYKTHLDGWWVMVPPFFIGPREVGFVLHKFW